MAATSFINEDDDLNFDWEAAVREIDSACLSSKPSTSNHQPPTFITNPKQSTLDNFFQKPAPVEDRIEQYEELSSIPIDPEAARTWIYPVNIPVRDYQLAITRTALFSNTLVALPTGLGKTLIAAVVMFNYFRWFPEGKIVFSAPSRPLVLQQIEACHNIVGIPQDWTIDMTGQVNPSSRTRLWKAKRVFFVTPQVLENDLQKGACLPRDLVCLVIDEAHRASGNYSYCGAVRELMDNSVQLRILALTATPGSKQQNIQQVIDNLHISTLEYRTETDADVSRYVHDRSIELIEVPMGSHAVEIQEILLTGIAVPFIDKLAKLGVHLKRDYKNLTTFYLLSIRDKCRGDLLQLNNDVEGPFGILITLCNILNLLSSHGIKQAYEMLIEKLKKGHFARMREYDSLKKAKLLMEQNLFHGAPSPKLSKMLEVLNDHFKTKDPSKSRVIIFSNFRASVMNIMDALSKIEYVKATQFIGQSSGKTLKGQSQKAQQEVLEKFRAGVYNVIVATSIGEEGLDIMEVDLVLCFDANISPLRMIQRMGRTGRKSDGRVVVLACEGSELKGYKRKLTNANTIKKLLSNGGMNSFNFHPSPRMIPHVFKPKVELVELSIEQFVHRGRKVKDDHPRGSPVYEGKLTDEESNLIAMYFDPAEESSTWRPSLIAFPHFQGVPSRVHRVMHSIRTGMLIDAMQSLQGLSFTKDSEASIREEEDMPNWDLEGATARQQENCTKDSWISHNSQEECASEKAPICDPLATENTEKVDCDHNPLSHSYLFGPDVVSLDSVGRVMVLPVPVLLVKEISLAKCSKKGSLPLESPFRDFKDTSRVKYIFEPITSSVKCTQTKDASLLSASGPCNEFKDIELSPRLSSYIQNDFVPESPLDFLETPSDEEKGNMMVPDLGSPCKLNSEASPRSPSIPVQRDKSELGMHLPASSINDEVQTPIIDNIKRNGARASVILSPIPEQFQAPLADSSSDGCSKDWHLSSGDRVGSVQQERKLKRLRKYGDPLKFSHPEGEKKEDGINSNKARALARSNPIDTEDGVGKKQRAKDARVFIEEEAEVSLEVEASDDEEHVLEISSSYEDSFIDDKVDPKETASTQAETSTFDMMAIYRRSLLSQSPVERLSNGCTAHSLDSVTPNSRTSKSATPSGTMISNPRLDTPDHVPETESIRKNSSESVSCRESGIHKESKHETWNQKRKLSFNHVPIINLETEFSAQVETYSCAQVDKLQRSEANDDVSEDDDKFYEGIDLDALEEQAAKLLQNKSKDSCPERTATISTPNILGMDSSPSFDLGI